MREKARQFKTRKMWREIQIPAKVTVNHRPCRKKAASSGPAAGGNCPNYLKGRPPSPRRSLLIRNSQLASTRRANPKRWSFWETLETVDQPSGGRGDFKYNTIHRMGTQMGRRMLPKPPPTSQDEATTSFSTHHLRSQSLDRSGLEAGVPDRLIGSTQSPVVVRHPRGG